VLGHSDKKSTPAESVSSGVAEKCPTPPPTLAPLASVKPCHGKLGLGQDNLPLNVAPGVFRGGSISTGVPVDTLVAPTPTPSPLPFARSPAPVAAYSAAWPAYQAPLAGKGEHSLSKHTFFSSVQLLYQYSTPWRARHGAVHMGLGSLPG